MIKYLALILLLPFIDLSDASAQAERTYNTIVSIDRQVITQPISVEVVSDGDSVISASYLPGALTIEGAPPHGTLTLRFAHEQIMRGRSVVVEYEAEVPARLFQEEYLLLYFSNRKRRSSGLFDGYASPLGEMMIAHK